REQHGEREGALRPAPLFTELGAKELPLCFRYELGPACQNLFERGRGVACEAPHVPPRRERAGHGTEPASCGKPESAERQRVQAEILVRGAGSRPASQRQNGSREMDFSMRSTNGCLSSASVSFGWIRLTSTAAMGFCTRPTIVTSLMVMTRVFFCAVAGPVVTSSATPTSRGQG